MPTKEQLTESLKVTRRLNDDLREQLTESNLKDQEARVYGEIVQALNGLKSEGTGYRPGLPTSAVSRVLNAAAARFEITMDYRTLTEAIAKLTEASQTQTELEELKNRWSAIEQVMYPRTVEFDPMKRG